VPLERFEPKLQEEIAALELAGTAKGVERVVVGVLPASGARGPRFLLEGEGDRPFLRMNSNSYLGLGLDAALVHAEEEAARRFGVGPGAVRFISGTYAPHVALERALADFHGRDAAMIASSAYSAMLGVLASLTTPETAIVSDELNHNCIINAMKLSRPKARRVYKHNDVAALERALEESVADADAVIVVTDGVFSMRGDYAPLARIAEVVARHEARFARGIVFVVDDSHGVGAYGASGRGTEEVCGLRDAAGRAATVMGVDVLVGTLGKAFGVNGGYVASSAAVVRYLREKNPLYIYTNPITPSEASAALAALGILRSDEGVRRLAHLGAMTRRFEAGLRALGFETIPSPHPVTPLVVRDTERTRKYVNHLYISGILATGLAYPVVPRGEELIRFQVCADHTTGDIDEVLSALRALR
jgi:glycine C-acetyltransferase